MALPLKILASFVVILSVIGVALSMPSPDAFNPPPPKAISDLKDAIVKGLGLQSDDLKISGFDLRDAQVGHSLAYEFDIEVGKKMYPIKLLEDVSRWEYVDLPIFRTEHPAAGDTSLAKAGTSAGRALPVLAPFQLAGPMELWIQDGDDMRVSLPHDVDAGIVKKVMLAEGAVVTVTGARSVSLRHPLDLPLPLNGTSDGGLASGLLTLANHLRLTSISEKKPLLSLRIVGPTSLTSPSAASASKLKLKRLGHGLVELSKAKSTTIPLVPVEEDVKGHTILTPSRFSTLWPIPSLDASNSNLQGFESLLYSVLGDKAKKAGSFRLVKADVSAQTSIKMGFRVDRKIKEGEMDWSSFPEWRTKPETIRMFFEVLGKVEGDRVVAEKVLQVPDPVQVEDTVAAYVLSGNRTMTSMPVVRPPPDYMTL